MASEFDAVVVGAGAAGIAAGRRLVEGGASTLILEARQRLGGRAWTVPSAIGTPLDLGCEWLHSADRNPWTDIAGSLGFAIDQHLPDWRTRIARRYGDAAQAEWEAARAAYDGRCIAAAKRAEDMPAARLLEPGGRWNGLLDAVSTWGNGVELDRLSVQDHARYSDSGVNWRLFAGYGALISAYAAGLPIRLGTVVRAIDHGGRTRLRIATDEGDVLAQAAIVTVPSNVLAAEAIRFVPSLPEKLAAAAGLPLGVANKLFLRLEDSGDAFSRDHHMLGHRDRTATGAYLLRPHDWPIVSGYFGGRLATELEAAGPEAMTQFALDELAGIFGESIRQRLSFLASSAWVGDPLARGSYSYALPGHAGDRAILAAPVEDRLFFAGEACSAHDFSTAHGAYRTGRAAAEAALAALGKRRPGV